jgi:hypothetical protein
MSREWIGVDVRVLGLVDVGQRSKFRTVFDQSWGVGPGGIGRYRLV